jgi:CubicO group peptidase (beta-lactamase class C family)
LSVVENDKFVKLDGLFNRYVNNGELPGAIVLIQKDGEIVYDKLFGYFDIENKIKMKPNALFRLQSMIKPIISMCILKLQEEGKLSINDKLSNFYPSASEIKVFIDQRADNPNFKKVDNEITILDLLQHTSGLVYGWDEMENVVSKKHKELLDALWSKKLSFDEFVEQLIYAGLRFEPGTKFQYGPNFDVLLAIIEKITNLPYYEYLNEAIFDPLEMNSTTAIISDQNNDLVNPLYVKKGEELAKVEPSPRGWEIYSTGHDYLNFASMLLNKGKYKGKEQFSEASVELLMKDYLEERKIPSTLSSNWRINFYKDYGFGLGVSVKRSDGIVPKGINGWPGAYSTYYWVDPKNSIAGILMAQTPSLFSRFFKFTELTYECINKDPNL